jgi:hypothetical protein
MKLMPVGSNTAFNRACISDEGVDDKSMTTGFSTVSPAQAKREISVIRKAAKEIIAKNGARAFLVKHGFATKEGKLTKRYR